MIKFQVFKQHFHWICMLALLILITGCDNVKQKKTFYTAVRGRDTAFLQITVYEKRFYGSYQVYYGSRSMKDSGAVEGQISGDTLRGKFRYISYGGSKAISPIIFLQRKGKLIQGEGVVASYMGISYFMPEIPIEFDADGFVFDRVHQYGNNNDYGQ
ncbi:hypothetical protein [Flavobacterium johnsoniae]|uniref:hypothetical protein n=1 Tax=Flavobacterium johnsoniae TaxID=986 RepID=UPI0011EC59FC|nr:hypothetical protein [Flavobacterium johnsoniae]